MRRCLLPLVSKMRKVGDFPPLPAKQLAMVLENLDIRVPLVQLCKRLGISDRTHRDWMSGHRLSAEFDTVDMVLTRLGLLWWEVWNEETTRLYAFTVTVYDYRRERPGRAIKRTRLRSYQRVDLGPDLEALKRVEYAFTGENGQGEQLEMAA